MACGAVAQLVSAGRSVKGGRRCRAGLWTVGESGGSCCNRGSRCRQGQREHRRPPGRVAHGVQQVCGAGER